MSIDDDISEILTELNSKVRKHAISDIGNIATVTLHQTCLSLSFALCDFTQEAPPLNKASCRQTKNGTLELNAVTLRHIYQSAKSNELLPELDEKEQLRIGVSLFALHEAYHVVQGVAKYTDVAIVKESTGRRQFVRFDLKSDIAAALTLATLDLNNENIGGLGRAYFAYLSAAMGMSLKVFELPADNHYKVSRLLSLYASRQSFIESIVTGTPYFPTMYCSFDEKFTSITLYDISDSGIEKLRSAKTLSTQASSEIKIALKSNSLKVLHTTLITLGVFA